MKTAVNNNPSVPYIYRIMRRFNKKRFTICLVLMSTTSIGWAPQNVSSRVVKLTLDCIKKIYRGLRNINFFLLQQHRP